MKRMTKEFDLAVKMINSVDAAKANGLLLVYSGDYKQNIQFEEEKTVTEGMFDCSEFEVVQNQKSNRYNRRRATRKVARKRANSDRKFYGDDISTKFGRQITEVGRYEKLQRHIRPHRDDMCYQICTNKGTKRAAMDKEIVKAAMDDYQDFLKFAENDWLDESNDMYEEYIKYQNGYYDSEESDDYDDYYDDYYPDYYDDDYDDYNPMYDDDDELPHWVRSNIEGVQNFMERAEEVIENINTDQNNFTKEEILLKLANATRLYGLAKKLVDECVEAQQKSEGWFIQQPSLFCCKNIILNI